ncbi:WXG100 family type VII secretion target [Streptomyces sp. NPDC005122]
MPDGSYDMSRLHIDPQALSESATRLSGLAEEVGESVLRASNAVSHLKLSWVSASAQEAQEFQDRWKRVMTQMFGDGHDAYGVLPVMAGGLKGVAIGFSQVEVGLEKFFNGLTEALHGSGGGGDSDSTPSDQGGPNSATTEDFPN